MKKSIQVKGMEYRIGDMVRILYMHNEPEYNGKAGVITHIDDACQIHGTWGGCAIIPEIDEFRIIEGEA